MHSKVIHSRDSLLRIRRGEEHHLAHIQHLRIEHTNQRHAVGSLLVAASEHDKTALILVGQEFEALGVLERVDILVLLVEQDGVRLCQGVEGFQDRMHRCWAFRAVQEEGSFGGFDELGLFGFEHARGARVLGFAVESFISMGISIQFE